MNILGTKSKPQQHSIQLLDTILVTSLDSNGNQTQNLKTEPIVSVESMMWLTLPIYIHPIELFFAFELQFELKKFNNLSDNVT